MSMNGFIKLHRKILEWGWYDDPNTKIVFLHLLLTANYSDSCYKGIDLKPGQTVTGRKSLSEALGISEQEVRTALNHLKSTNEITIKSTNKFSVVTIVNWESYQCVAEESTNEVTDNLTNNQPTTNQQLTNNQPHYKNNKNNKNRRTQEEKKDIYSAERTEIINCLNDAIGSNYRPNTKKTKDLIHARLSEGFTVEDFKTVIYRKTKQWQNDPKMVKFLRPETLFGNKFEGYLNERMALSSVERWDFA